MTSPASTTKQVRIFTDGACTGNPGPGGYAAILQYGEHRREIAGGFRRTTNNRMELMAVIAALDTLTRPCEVTVVSDSEYVVNSISKGWARGWRARGWRKSSKDIVPNWELWDRLLLLCERHSVRFQWVEGHAGHAENERCDELAVAETRRPELPADAGYEQKPPPPSLR